MEGDEPAATGVLVVRVWLERSRPPAIRARITATTDVRRPPTVSAAGGADDVLEAVRRWLGAFTAGSDDGQEPPLTLK